MEESTWQVALRDAGAVFSSESTFAPIALHFGDGEAEYEAATQNAVVFDVSDRTQIELTGSDRATFLHNFCTNDVKRLSPGEGCEAFVTSIKGRVLGHVHLFLEETSLWIDSVPDSEGALIAHLDRYLITDDVQLHARSAEWAELYLAGPKCRSVLDACGLTAEISQPGSHVSGAFAGVNDVRIRRVDWFGEFGVLICVAREQLPQIWKTLLDNDARPAGSLAFHALRIASRYPWYGIDITDENLAQEVDRTAQAISFTKGCYLGQEPIARLDAMGHVNRQLCGIKLDHGPAPTAGDVVIAPGDETRKAIGTVTSAVQPSAEQAPLALGYLRSRFAKHGTEILVTSDGQDIPATVFSESSQVR